MRRRVIANPSLSRLDDVVGSRPPSGSGAHGRFAVERCAIYRPRLVLGCAKSAVRGEVGRVHSRREEDSNKQTRFRDFPAERRKERDDAGAR
ncbi:hypothetical protein MRX96_022730 [Rhipicephalus microplus]